MFVRIEVLLRRRIAMAMMEETIVKNFYPEGMNRSPESTLYEKHVATSVFLLFRSIEQFVH